MREVNFSISAFICAIEMSNLSKLQAPRPRNTFDLSNLTVSCTSLLVVSKEAPAPDLAMSQQFNSPDKAANLYSGPNLTQSAALGSMPEASALNSPFEPAAPSSHAGISVARRGSGAGGHNRTNSADMKTLEQIQAENAELKLTIDSLKFYDDPDKACLPCSTPNSSSTSCLSSPVKGCCG